MNRAKIFTAFIFLLAFAVCVSAQKSEIEKFKVNDKDKAEILDQVFADGFEKLIGSSQFNQCLTPIVDQKKVVFLMTDIDENLIPKMKAYRSMIMSYSQISEEVKKNNGECYFKLNNFQIVDSKVRISLDRYIDEIYRFENSSKYTRWISGEGYIYEFEKDVKWKMISSKKIIISS